MSLVNPYLRKEHERKTLKEAEQSDKTIIIYSNDHDQEVGLSRGKGL